MRRSVGAALVAIVVVAVLAAVPAPPPARAQLGGAQDEACPAVTDLPGVEVLQVTCLEDLTTLSNPRMDPTTYGWGGSGTRSSPALNSAATDLPEDPIPGVQLEGWFAGDSCSRYEVEHNASFMPTCPGGFRHNGQFVMRIPDAWDGVHLLVAGAPGVRTQFANDIIISDWAVSRGWAYIAHDKGNTGLNFFRTGDDETGGELATWEPPAAIAQWGTFMETAAVAGRAALAQAHGAEPTRTYAAGISNGGHQVRLALERHPDLFDGGVDWEGTLIVPESPNLFSAIPPILQAYPAFRSSGDPAAFDRLVHEAHLPPDSQPVWDNHYSIYWGAVASTYRPVIDPEYTDYAAAPRLVVPPGDPDADYDYDSRPEVVRDRVASIANTGDTSGRPLITIHGTLDALLPISYHADRYADMVRAAGHDDAFRYYVVEGGTHVDTAADTTPDVFRPLLPCFWASLEALDAWVVEGRPAPPSGFVPFPEAQTPAERANTCGLPEPVGRVAGADRVETAVAASRASTGIAETVVVATAADFPDALAAAPLATALDAPLLLVGPELTDVVRRELARTGAVEAVVVGGEAAVPATVADAIQAEGVAVRRLAGGDRYATAAAVAAEVAAVAGPPQEVVVASGEGFADALSAGPVAAVAGSPILLTAADALPPATGAAIEALAAERSLVVGGEAAVSPAVAAALPNPTRVGGADRYATSAALADLAVARGHQAEEVLVVTGRGFADALAAGPVAARGESGSVPGGLLLLVDGLETDGSPATTAWLAARRGSIERLLLVGGEAAISPAVEAALG